MSSATLPGASVDGFVDRGPAIIAVCTTSTVLAMLAVAARMWVRTRMIRSVGAEDYIIIFAMVSLYLILIFALPNFT